MITKICIACGTEKFITKFFKRKDSKDGYNNTCKECRNIITSNYAKTHRVQINLKSKKWRDANPDKINIIPKRNRLLLLDIKKNSGCCKCGESNPICLDFHHIDPTIKDMSVANMVAYSDEKLKLEINKCVIVCKNCHAKIHTGLITI
jgi:hypothetical protein